MTGYCADHDPILQVPRFCCSECKAPWHVTDAEWLDDEFDADSDQLILAAIEIDHAPACSGWSGGETVRTVVLVSVDDPGDGNWRLAPSGNARKARAAYHLKDTGYPLGTWFCNVCNAALPGRSSYFCDEHRCTATTAAGNRCGNKAKHDDLCRVHIAQKVRRQAKTRRTADGGA